MDALRCHSRAGSHSVAQCRGQRSFMFYIGGDTASTETSGLTDRRHNVTIISALTLRSSRSYAKRIDPDDCHFSQKTQHVTVRKRPVLVEKYSD
jgi:hypothetical protein